MKNCGCERTFFWDKRTDAQTDGRLDEQKLTVSIHMYLLVMHGKRGQRRKGPEKKKGLGKMGSTVFLLQEGKRGVIFLHFISDCT